MGDRKRAHLWTDEERIVLRLLYTQFPNTRDGAVRVQAFNTVFTNEHRILGVPNGRDNAALRGAWSDRVRRAMAWENVEHGPVPGQEPKWEALRVRIQNALSSSGRDDDAAAVPPVPPTRGQQQESQQEQQQEQQYQEQDQVPMQSRTRARNRTSTNIQGNSPQRTTSAVVCDGCFEDITATGEESYTCVICPIQHYCSTCYLDRTIKKCHAKELVLERHPSRDTPMQETPAPPIQGPGSTRDGWAMDVDPTPSSAIHTTRPAPTQQQLSNQPSALDQSSFDTPLEMIHSKQVIWAGQQAFWQPAVNTQVSISQSSPVYQAGGKAHRVIIGTPRNATAVMDLMICSLVNCRTCNDNEVDINAIRTNNGTPFVHTADTMPHPAGLVFDPVQNPRHYDRQRGGFTESRLNNVVYCDGKMRATEVCLVRKCDCYNDALLRGNWESQHD